MKPVVRWSPEHGCYVFHCLYGCFGWDYESQPEADRALAEHVCVSKA